MNLNIKNKNYTENSESNLQELLLALSSTKDHLVSKAKNNDITL